eukprot:GILJ01003688.1.p1 GENE.GILJ01003688.1~~GILJ01003688.1.p1  ORF type:complete len:233 (+),score=46.42 GILJ01003688.1:84-701(+)
MQASDFEESDEAFRAQFDRSHESFHKGDTRPVPVGGARVPEALRNEADWRNLPVVESTEEVDYGPEYKAVLDRRNMLGEMKKTVSAIPKPVEAVTKILVALGPDATDDQKEEADKLIAQANAARDAELKELDGFLVHFQGDDADSVSKREFIAKVRTESLVEYGSRDSYGDYMLRMRRYGESLFKEQKALLDRLKQIKKEHSTTH